MKTINVVGVLIFATILGALAFESGRYYQIPIEHNAALTKKAGYYNIETGNYTYGVPPVITPQVSASTVQCVPSRKVKCPTAPTPTGIYLGE